MPDSTGDRTVTSENATADSTDNLQVTQPTLTGDRTDKPFFIEQVFDRLKATGRAKKRVAPAFTPPTLEQVTAYCGERGDRIDPERFLNHYQSNGWRVGKNPMRDRQAAVRTWELNGISQNGTSHVNKAEQRRDDNLRAAEKARAAILAGR